jgi:alpha-L-fucosidase
VSTRKGNRLYVHLLEAPDTTVLLPPLGAKIRSARFMTSGRAAEFSEHDFGVVVKLPRDAVDPIDTIVELVLSS